MFKNVESERFIEAIDYLITNKTLKSYYKLAQELNIPQQRFSDIKSGKQSVQLDLIDSVCELYPEINRKYILSCEDEKILNLSNKIEEPQQVYNIKPKKMENLTFEELLFQYKIEKEVSADLNNHVLDLNRENQILKQQLKFIREICLKCETCKKALENGKIKNSFG